MFEQNLLLTILEVVVFSIFTIHHFEICKNFSSFQFDLLVIFVLYTIINYHFLSPLSLFILILFFGVKCINSQQKLQGNKAKWKKAIYDGVEEIMRRITYFYRIFVYSKNYHLKVLYFICTKIKIITSFFFPCVTLRFIF